jgi:hypothetical protein
VKLFLPRDLHTSTTHPYELSSNARIIVGPHALVTVCSGKEAASLRYHVYIVLSVAYSRYIIHARAKVPAEGTH